MILETLAAAFIIGLIWGGRLTNLGSLQFRYIAFIFLAYLIQVGIDFGAPRYYLGVYPYLHMFSYVLLIMALLKNWSLSGIPLILTGTVLNFLPILFNNGQMPVRADMVTPAMAEILASGWAGTHGLTGPSTKLGFLADVIFLPLPYYPQLVSLGDLVINLGLLFLIIKGMKVQGSLSRETP